MAASAVSLITRLRTMLRVLFPILAASAGAASTAVAVPAVARGRTPSTPQATVFQGSDYASWGHGALQVCDSERDGHSVYVEYSHNGYAGRVYDSGGSSGACQKLGVGVPVVFRACEEAYGTHWCSGWAHITSAGEKIYLGHDDAAYHPYSRRQFACDRERDGHSVYAEYWTSSGSHGKVVDHNGSASGCGAIGARVWKFRVCEDIIGPNVCSDMVRTWDNRVGD